MKKAQIGAITAVLLTGITVGVASVVYVWGQPILDKRDSGDQLDEVESLVLDIQSEVKRVSQSGTGATSDVPMQIDSDEYSINIVELNASNDYIDVVVEGGEFPYPEGSWTLLSGEAMRNLSISGGDYVIEGEGAESVILARPESGVTTYRVEFRNLFSEGEEVPVEKTDLVPGGSNVTGSGSIYMQNAGEEVNRGNDGLTLSSGQTVSRELSKIEVDMR